MRGFLAAYDAMLARWPVAVDTIDVPSVYGTTRVNACGPHEAPALVLLHSGGATSTVWFANVGELSRARRVYAVDLIGDPGRSVNDGQRLRTASDLMSWLDGVFDHLGLGQADLCGHSYGGWIALSYTLHAPQRVRRLALLDPTKCFAGLRPSYLLHAAPLLVRPSAARLRAFLAWETGGFPLDPGWLDVAALGAEFPSSKVVMPRRPDPARLRASTVPTLVLLAGESRAHDIRRVETNARRMLPVLASAVLPGVSHHSTPTAHPGELNRRLLEFLA